MQALLSSFNIRDDASQELLRNAHNRLEAYREASASPHLRLKSYLTSGLLQFLSCVARFEKQGGETHRNSVVEVASSASAALELESHDIIDTLRASKAGIPYPALALIP